MKIAFPDGEAHLGLCLNVFPGETLPEVASAITLRIRVLARALARELGGPPGLLGFGPWLSAAVAAEILDQDLARTWRKQWEAENRYVFTLNGFPWGRFHGGKIKEEVYRPDWTDPRREEYTRNLARILAAWLPNGVTGSISTLPVGYGGPGAEKSLVPASEVLTRIALFLARLREETGKEIVLALEPEPGCLLDLTSGVAAFFEEELFRSGVRHLASQAGVSKPRAAELLRRHLGVCLDTVHLAVNFEDPVEALAALSRRGIRIAKVQVAAAPVYQGPAKEAPRILGRFADDVYLHQTKIRDGKGTRYHSDLPEAWQHARGFQSEEWRVHYHLPLSWPGGEGIATTQELLSPEFFRAAIAFGVRHFEVEVYTLPLLSPPAPPDTPETVLARDLAEVQRRLLGALRLDGLARE